MNYAKIKHFDIANGEGVRISLFVSGCKFNCKNCFNKEAQNYNYGYPYTEATKQEIITLVKNPNIDGLSILGGDPLWQNEKDLLLLTDLVKEIKKINKTVWIWSGFTWETIFPNEDFKQLSKLQKNRQILISNCDIFVDGQFEEENKNLMLKWRGSSNQRVIDVQKTLKTKTIIRVKE